MVLAARPGGPRRRSPTSRPRTRTPTGAIAHTKELQDRLFEEIRGRILETDLSVPVRKGPWWYYSRTEEGKQYAIAAAGRAGGPTTEPTTRPRPSRSCSTRTSRRRATSTSPSARSTSPPTTGCWPGRSTPPAASSTSCASATCAAATTCPTSSPATYYGTAWAADGRDLLLRPARRRHAAVPGVAPRARHDPRRRRARVPGGRRALLPRRRPTKDERFLVLHLGSKVTDEVLLPRRRRPDRRRSASSSRASRTSSTASSTTATASSSSPTPTAPRTSSWSRRPSDRPAGRTGARSSPTAPT